MLYSVSIKRMLRAIFLTTTAVALLIACAAITLIESVYMGGETFGSINVFASDAELC